ncbi:MAG: pitrilysin family protein [Novosphingobium sp.]
MRRFLATSTLAIVLAGCAPQHPAAVLPPPDGDMPRIAAPAPAPLPPAPQPATLADLVSAVDIPYEHFSMANGLNVLVHTDRKAPVVGVTLYYRVGSKNEPRGKTGFAHLYEHLFFGGSENVPNFDVPLEAAGSTATNGSTWYDRTNYVETVPKGALDLALFMESDRMGHLLGALTQPKLRKQRGVVQNEKRQGDNQPYGLFEYAVGDGLFPVGHPYRHATIGSMADLDAASLADVRQWFLDNYAPNNVVLALTGDIDAATARPLVEKWFGDIPRGPAVHKVQAGPVTLPAPVTRELTDRVPTLRLTRNWSGPGTNDDDSAALMVGLDILGGLSSSRLDNALVRGSQLAVQVTASDQVFEQISVLQATMDVKPGVTRADAEAAFDAVIARFLSKGPSADEVRRSATRLVSGEIGRLEEIGGMSGKGATLAEGLLYSGDPARYKTDLARIASLTPEDVRAAMQKWLSRPVLAINVTPGARTQNGDKLGGWGDEDSAPKAKKRTRAKAPARLPKLAKSPPRKAPPVAPVGDLVVPQVERSALANGIPVTLARRSGVPKVMVSLNFDAGIAADRQDTPGTQSLMLALLDDGTTTRDSIRIAEEQERLGATLSTASSLDSSAVTLSALSANLAPSLMLMADVARNPAFDPGEVARVRSQQLARLAQVQADPSALASRTLTPLLFGPEHPYGQPSDGLGNADSLAALTPQALRAAHDKWLRPDLARITVVGDVTMADLKPLLEQAFGNWIAAGTKPVKSLDKPVPQPRPRVVVIDRPGSPQSVIMAGRVLPLTGRDSGHEALDLANEVLGNDFLSRLNLDLREEKSWSYGVYSAVSSPIGPRMFYVVAPVQADKTGASIRQLRADMAAFPASKPVVRHELTRVTDGNIRGLPMRFQTNAQVLSALVINDRLGRPADYYATLPARYRAIDASALNAAAKAWLQPGALTYVVVGDRKLIAPQLAGIGLPVEYVSAPPSGN